MITRKWLTAWLTVVAIVLQSFVPASAWAADAADPQGVVFDPAQQNAVRLNAMLENVPATFEMRVKFAPNPNHRQILFGNYRGGAATQFSVELTAANQFRYYEVSNDGKVIDRSTSGLSIATGEWTHLVVTRDVADRTVSLILDGTVAAVFENLDLPELVPMASIHSIGTDTRNTHHIRAEVAEVRLWSSVRTLDELRDNVDAEIQGDEPGLMHAWTLNAAANGGVESVIRDKAGKIDGTPVGFGSPYEGEFEGTGASFADGLDVATKQMLQVPPRTVEAWVNVPANTSGGQRVGVIAGNYEPVSYADESRFSFEIFSGGAPRLYWVDHKDYQFNFVAGNVNVNVGDWMHIAIVLDDENSKATTYVNGEMAYEETLTVPIPVKVGRELKIGSDYRYDADGKPSMAFKGEIADVRLWSTVRTAEEIEANYNTALQGNEAGLLGNWKLNQLTDGVYADTSAQQNDGYLYDDESYNWLAPNFPKGDYTIAVLPDTQNMAKLHPEALKDYFQWMRDRAEELNIVLAIGVGDIVDTPSSAREWADAAEAYAYLDGVVPYIAPPGNHDVILNNTTLERDYTNYNTYFPYSKYSQEPAFGGAFEEGKMENTYHLYEIGGLEFLVVALEFAPGDEVLAWANDIVAAHPDKRVIVETHSYMYHNGERIGPDHIHYPSYFMSDANDGDDMWDKFVSLHDNIVLVLSGHISSPDLVIREDVGVHGNTVQQVLADAQGMQPLDLGMIMLMTFTEGSDDVAVNWYSVKYDMLYRAKNQLSMKLELYGASPLIGDVDGNGKVDILDAAAILKLIVAAPGEADEAMLAAADINGDGSVDSRDVLALLQLIADNLALTPAE